MKLSSPKFSVFLISLILAVAAVLSFFGIASVPVVDGNTFYILLVSYVLLALGNILKGF